MGVDAECFRNCDKYFDFRGMQQSRVCSIEYAGGILPVLQVSCQLLQSFTTDSSFIGLTHHSWTFYISIGRVFLHHGNDACDKNLDDYDHHILFLIVLRMGEINPIYVTNEAFFYFR